MRLVKLSDYSSTYINMDYITEVSKDISVSGRYYAIILDKHTYKINEETYNTILKYGEAKI